MLPFRIIDRIKFLVERQLVKGAGFQLLVVAAFIAFISLLGGLLVVPLGESFDDAGAAIWWAFLRLTDPGYLGDDVGVWQRIVSTMLTVSGYVVFMGTLVAILTRWLIAKMADLERGLTPVTLKNHIVILGWTSQTLPLLAELLGTSGRMRRFLEKHDAQRLNLVVLSEDASADQVHELRAEPGIGRRARQIILRSGSAIQPEALHRVACLDAAAVIVPSAAHEAGSLVTSDVETVKALLSIAAQARHFHSPLPFVVAEIQDVRKLPVIERAYPGAVEVVAGDATISRLMVQNLLHPGLSEVYNELLTAGDGNEIYVRGGESVAGMTLSEVASARPRVIVLGLLRQQGTGWDVRLVARSDTRIESSDRVIMLARDYSETDANPKLAPLPEVSRTEILHRPTHAIKNSHRVLILGWNRRVPSLIAEFASYRQLGFEVDLVSVVPVVEREQAIARYVGEGSRVRCHHIEADYMVEDDLRRVDPAGYDSVILLSSDRLASDEEADARAMVGYLQLEDILKEGQRRPQLIMELSDPDNRHLLDGHQSEMLISPMILSHVLGQVALRRELRVVLDELFTVGGAEIQFRDPEDYPLPASVDFQLLEKIVASEGEIALGIYRAEPNGAGRHLELNPPRKSYLDIRPADRLLVLSLTDGG
ncbi:Potassium voltage-gated channel subfamily KQT [Marinobacter nitratireducens]|uniref:Potassium voltage-gated channel subfamily KQT n=1 Tax=Marinobacter nitratireducens TaxID=1137280 RepID=A0A072N0I4_9GAMM|nr:ion channel DMI1 [Marinobacter nitratireducens]KEF30737.1 Potassium voltage-gated channel subfamily KQT [Marinobacter nitratireducens]TNE97838.1 MAG: ion channel DMI1 [Gammaproteobacteria bacterium]